MAKTHNLGFPRVGPHRELKKALESYWKGQSDAERLKEVAQSLRRDAHVAQQDLDFVPVGDFSLYDHVADWSFRLGNIPRRAQDAPRSLDNYFRVARGRSRPGHDASPILAAEMTKWLNTNYHYLVPEFSKNTSFSVVLDDLLEQVHEANSLGVRVKPVVLGPVSYLWLGKSKDKGNKLELLPELCQAYTEILRLLGDAGAEWIQMDEPCLVADLDEPFEDALRKAYDQLSFVGPKLLLASYFGRLESNLELLWDLPVHGVHVDAVSAQQDAQRLASLSTQSRVLSIGVIDGRNVWKSDLDACLDLLEPIHDRHGDRLWVAPSCSLLHVPVDADLEDQLDPMVKSWLSFARQKLSEVRILGEGLNRGRASIQGALQEQRACLSSRRSSPRTLDRAVRQRIKAIEPSWLERKAPFAQRAAEQASRLKLPPFPTTTIGSFPQTKAIRSLRARLKNGDLENDAYLTAIESEIRHCVERQEALGLDVLVHGESERNDMVEYFGQHLSGFAFTQHGWVQSYGSRCVKPPLLYGDVSRPSPMTVEIARFAQSCTKKPMKGMLTGPVTILNWSFVRDDQPRSLTCQQIALAMRDEVLDLQTAGLGIIQIDEAALREGLPLRKSDWQAYLRWAVDCFRLTAGGVESATQIHTHMCYSEFNDIMESIAEMDADVITIETSRSDMELLEAFETFAYQNAIGPGVYDIHSPNVPTEAAICSLLRKAAAVVEPRRLWVNPDCGLKTREWSEVEPALLHMVEAARKLRTQYSLAAE